MISPGYSYLNLSREGLYKFLGNLLCMKKHALRVELTIDTEADFYYLVPSPHFSKLDILKWKLNKFRGKLYRYPWPSRNGFINIVDSLKQHNFPATFCIVGHLYLKECKGFRHFNEISPQDGWYKEKTGNDWYSWDQGGNYRKYPGRYLGDLIEKEKMNKLFNFGLHAFTHEAMTLERKEVVESIISSGIAAAKKLGVKIDSFACPFELTEDEQEPEKVFNALRKNKIKRIFYSGKDNGLEIKRFFSIEKPKHEKGLEKIWISNYFEGTSSKEHMRSIMQEILDNKDKDATYCLVTHDFTHKNKDNINKILTFLKNEGF